MINLKKTLTATDARKSFFELIKQANNQHEIFEVQHKLGNTIIMSSDEYESLQETLHLLSAPNFKDKFDHSIKEADKGELVDFEEVFGEAL